MDIIEELAKRLTIEIDYNDAGKVYWAGSHTIIVKLKLDNEIISESTAYIPNNNTESAY